MAHTDWGIHLQKKTKNKCMSIVKTNSQNYFNNRRKIYLLLIGTSDPTQK